MSGTAALLTSAKNTVSDPYPVAVHANFASPDIVTPDWIDNSGTTGNRMVTDSTGQLTWAPSNMLLNSATLSTQTVTVTSGATNILSFYGTGSITYSGAASGTLSGTGASDRVSVVLTMTTTSLTVTVSGSVTQAQLERVTYQTQPRDWIPTTSAAVFMPRYDYDASTTPATPRGMLIEESRANLLTYSQTLATDWTDTSITRVSTTRTAPDGTSTALEASASSGNATILRNAAVGSSAQRVLSIWIKRVSGTGNIQYTTDNSTWTTQAITSSWVRYSFPATTENQQVGFRIVTSGDTIQIWGAQLEAGSFATSYIPTTSASVTRVADVVKMTSAAFSSFWNASAGTMAIEGTAFNYGMLSVSNGTTADRYYIIYNLSGKIQSGVVVGSSAQAGIDSLSSGYTAGTVYRTLFAYKANDFAAVTNNGTVVTDTSGTLPTVSELFLGSYWPTGTANLACGYIRSFAYYNQRLPDATLKSKSTVGASF